MITKITCNGELFEINTSVLMSHSILVSNMVKHCDEDILNGSLNWDHLDLKTWTQIYNWINRQDVVRGD